MDPITRISYFGSSGVAGDADSYFFLNIGTSGAHQHRDVAIGSDDSMYFAMRGNGDAAVLKVDVDGTFQWARRLDDSDGAIYNCNGVALDSSDNVYVSGSRIDTSTSPFSRKSFFFKYNSSGTVQFKKEFGDYQDVGEIITLNNGNILTAYFDGSKFIEFNTSGAAQNLKLFGGSTEGYNGAESEIFRQDSSGNIYFMGVTTSSGDRRLLLLKMTSSYSITWQKTFGTGVSGEDMYSQAFDVDSSGNIYVTGFFRNTSPEQGFIIKVNSSGTLQWAKGFGNTQSEPKALVIDSSDDIYIAGRTDGSDRPTGTNGDPLAIFKFNSSGSTVWERVFAMQDDVQPVDGLEINSLGTLIVLLRNKGTNTEGSVDSGILKIPTDGSKTGSYTFGSDTIKYESMTESFSNLTLTTTTPTFSIASFTETISTSTQAEVSLTMTTSTVAFS